MIYAHYVQVRGVSSGTATLKDATSEAIRDWVTNVEDTHYILGSAAGPHPYPMMVRDFQSIIGRETRKQCMEQFGGKPDILIACIGGGSNAIGLFHEFVEDADVRLIGACPMCLFCEPLFFTWITIIFDLLNYCVLPGTVVFLPLVFELGGCCALLHQRRGRLPPWMLRELLRELLRVLGSVSLMSASSVWPLIDTVIASSKTQQNCSLTMSMPAAKLSETAVCAWVEASCFGLGTKRNHYRCVCRYKDKVEANTQR